MAIHIDDSTDLDYKVPTSIIDGNMVGINKDSGSVHLMFYQTRKQTGDHIDKADVVGSVFMSNLQDLKNFRDVLTQVIEQHEKAEK